MVRRLIYPVAILFLLSTASYFGCDGGSLFTEVSPRPAAPSDGPSLPSTPTGALSIPDRTANTLLIGSFNVQRLGPTKLSKPEVVEQLAHIIRRFDVIALQEITSKDPTTLDQLLEAVNAPGAQYRYTISPRIGREISGYYEQYAFVYDSARIVSGPEYCYVVQDEADLLHREPFVGRFMTRTTTAQPFQFTLINVHTDPDEIDTELDVLAQVLVSVGQFEYPEDDVILVGDLNAAPGNLLGLERLPHYTAIVRDLPTNTRGTKTLDNIVLAPEATREFTSRYGVIELASWFQISADEALQISDHLPVWAEFTTVEQPAARAAALPAAGFSR
ncbi:MAG: deoxyribonuclease [Pirellulaceae bacterium]|nr:MAG: deoxyribonuclease [Pirellulaceae bacterium]